MNALVPHHPSSYSLHEGPNPMTQAQASTGVTLQIDRGEIVRSPSGGGRH